MVLEFNAHAVKHQMDYYDYENTNVLEWFPSMLQAGDIDNRWKDGLALVSLSTGQIYIDTIVDEDKKEISMQVTPIRDTIPNIAEIAHCKFGMDEAVSIILHAVHGKQRVKIKELLPPRFLRAKVLWALGLTHEQVKVFDDFYTFENWKSNMFVDRMFDHALTTTIGYLTIFTVVDNETNLPSNMHIYNTLVYSSVKWPTKEQAKKTLEVFVNTSLAPWLKREKNINRANYILSLLN